MIWPISDLACTNVSNVEPLSDLTNLTMLSISLARVSKADYETLQADLPTIDIYWSPAASAVNGNGEP